MCSFNQGRFVQARHHGLSLAIGAESRGTSARVKCRDGSAIKGGDANEVNASAFSRHGPRGGHHVIFVVFTVGQDHNRTRSLTLLIKAVPTRFDRTADGGALGGYHAGPHGFKEQTQGIEVGGQGALDIGFACKDDQAQTVACGVGGQPLNGSFCEVQSRHSDIFGHHAVADVQGDHHVDPFRFHFLESTAHLGVKPGDEQCPHRESQKEVFPSWQENAIAWKHTVDAAGIGQGLDGFLSPPQVANHDQSHQGRHQQERHKLHSM